MIIDEPVITFTRREAQRLVRLLELGSHEVQRLAPAQLTPDTRKLLNTLFTFAAAHASDSGRSHSSPRHPNMATESGTRPPGAEWITTTEAAKVLRVSESRVRQIAPDLDGVKFGTGWMFTRATIEQRRSK